MVRNVVNSVVLQSLFYNLMAVIFVGSLIAVIIVKVAIGMGEIDLAIAFVVALITGFTFLYFA